MPSHKYRTNQSVQLVGRGDNLKPLGPFSIVRPLPTEHGILQYRIKSLIDGHERVVTESEIA